jgi:hypothetical protein
LVLQTATLSFRDFVVRVGTSDLVSPLHLISLDDQRADFRLSINCRQERNNEVSSILSIGLKLALFRLDTELSSGTFSKERLEGRVLLDMVSESEGDTGCLLQGTVDVDDVIYLRLSGFENGIELPSTSTALIDHQLSLGLERLEWLEPHVEVEGIHSHIQGV